MITHLVVQSAIGARPFKIDECLLGALADEVNDLDLGGVCASLAGVKRDLEGILAPDVCLLYVILEGCRVCEDSPKGIVKEPDSYED